MSKNLTRRGFVASSAAVAALSRLPIARAADPLKVGFVYVTPLSAAGWTAQHQEGRLQMERTLGARVQARHVENVSEGPDAERVIRDLAQQGHRLIFTTSFGYMEPTLKVARDFPQTAFEHVSGYRSAANVGVVNARFYEGRYLAGMAAGGVSRTGVAGCVAAFPIPEVVHGINAFVLGMRAVNPAATLKVVWVNTWHDPGRERDAALTLMNQGADVVTHHTDSTAVAIAAQEKGRWCVAYHSDMRAFAPTAQLTAVTHHWGGHYTRSAQAVLENRWQPGAVWGGLREGMIGLAEFGPAVPEAVRVRVRERQAAIASGKFHPFSGRLLDNVGRVRQTAGSLSDEALNRVDWYVEGVQGKLPGA